MVASRWMDKLCQMASLIRFDSVERNVTYTQFNFSLNLKKFKINSSSCAEVTQMDCGVTCVISFKFNYRNTVLIQSCTGFVQSVS